MQYQYKFFFSLYMKNIKQTIFSKIEHYSGGHGGNNEGSHGGSHGGNNEGSHSGSHSGSYEGGSHDSSHSGSYEGSHEGREHEHGYSRSNHNNTGYLSGGDGWSGYYLNYPYYIIDSPDQNITTTSTPSTSTNQQANFIQPIVNPYDLLYDNKYYNTWESVSKSSECSVVNVDWNDNNLSTDESCVCSSGNKASNIVNNKVVYKCQVSDQSPP